MASPFTDTLISFARGIVAGGSVVATAALGLFGVGLLVAAWLFFDVGASAASGSDGGIGALAGAVLCPMLGAVVGLAGFASLATGAVSAGVAAIATLSGRRPPPDAS